MIAQQFLFFFFVKRVYLSGDNLGRVEKKYENLELSNMSRKFSLPVFSKVLKLLRRTTNHDGDAGNDWYRTKFLKTEFCNIRLVIESKMKSTEEVCEAV